MIEDLLLIIFWSSLSMCVLILFLLGWKIEKVAREKMAHIYRQLTDTVTADYISDDHIMKSTSHTPIINFEINPKEVKVNLQW